MMATPPLRRADLQCPLHVFLSLDVGEVEVHRTLDGDDFHDAPGGDGEGVVGFRKCVDEGQVGINGAQPFVVDDHQRVDILLDGIHAVDGLEDFIASFKEEGDGDDADGQDVHFLGDTSNSRCSSCTSSSSHTCSDENHLRTVVQHILYFLNTFFGSFFSLIRAITRSQSFVSQLELYRNGRFLKSFTIGVTYHEGYIVDTFTIHVVNSITASSPYSDDFDNLR